MKANTSYLMNTYSQLPVTFTHGDDVYLFDEQGNKYLDFVAGIAVNCLGYSNESLQKALKEQMDKMLHISNLYYSDILLETAEILAQKTDFDQVFFCNSGTEAVEAALKLARKYQSRQGQPEKHEIIAMTNSFHGRTFGSVTATGQAKYKDGLFPILPGVKHVPYNDCDALKEAVTDKSCAILMEVIQGEGGIVEADKEFLALARSLCDQEDMLLIFDEVQTGIGRLGTVLGYMSVGVKPDVVAMAKGLGAGVPVGAIAVNSRGAKGFKPGDHASTFGGNPLAMSAVNVVAKEVLNTEFLEHVQDMGHYLKEQLEAVKEAFDCVLSVRGKGLMQGLELSVSPQDVTKRALEKGLLLVGAGSNVIRFVPPLIIKKHQIDDMINILKEVL